MIGDKSSGEMGGGGSQDSRPDSSPRRPRPAGRDSFSLSHFFVPRPSLGPFPLRPIFFRAEYTALDLLSFSCYILVNGPTFVLRYRMLVAAP